jgi:hypothetical protein
MALSLMLAKTFLHRLAIRTERAAARMEYDARCRLVTSRQDKA